MPCTKQLYFFVKQHVKVWLGFTSNQSCEDFTAGFVCLKKDNILIMSYDALSHIRGLLVQSSYERERERGEGEHFYWCWLKVIIHPFKQYLTKEIICGLGLSHRFIYWHHVIYISSALYEMVKYRICFMLIVFWGFLYKCIFSIIPFCHHHHSIKNLRNFMCQNEMVEQFKNEFKKKIPDKLANHK